MVYYDVVMSVYNNPVTATIGFIFDRNSLIFFINEYTQYRSVTSANYNIIQLKTFSWNVIIPIGIGDEINIPHSLCEHFAPSP